MYLKEHNILSTNRIGKIFDNTSATYKYFWFLSIMQIHAKTENLNINVWDIVTRMVANAWYPIHYFKLSFGKSDSLYGIVNQLHKEINVPIDVGVEAVIEGIKSYNESPLVKKLLRTLTSYVPYKFLSPWLGSSTDREIVRRSQMLENDCLYSIHKEGTDFYININPKWNDFLHRHYNVLMDFAYWNLTLFLQARNPNVPAIPNKLIRPEVRNSLAAQHRYWNDIIRLSGAVNCIYTGRELYINEYELDHFIPWSFVSHDLLWNLIPADGSINSSKSNRLPDLNIYLPKLASMQLHGLKTFVKSDKKSKILEDFISLGYTANELVNMSDVEFLNIIERTFTPMNQIALNMGFETWKY